jgi:hypothetical protein
MASNFSSHRPPNHPTQYIAIFNTLRAIFYSFGITMVSARWGVDMHIHSCVHPIHFIYSNYTFDLLVVFIVYSLVADPFYYTSVFLRPFLCKDPSILYIRFILAILIIHSIYWSCLVYPFYFYIRPFYIYFRSICTSDLFYPF